MIQRRRRRHDLVSYTHRRSARVSFMSRKLKKRRRQNTPPPRCKGNSGKEKKTGQDFEQAFSIKVQK
jgi:hypothetical protein